MIAMLALIAACLDREPTAPDPAALLRAPDAEQRLRGFFLMDRATMARHTSDLLRLAAEDPSMDVRREVTRQLGYGGDPAVRDYLDAALDGELAEEAAESLTYLGPAGCEALARRWVLAPRGSHGHLVDLRLERALRQALAWNGTQCGAALAEHVEAYPDRVAELEGERRPPPGGP